MVEQKQFGAIFLAIKINALISEFFWHILGTSCSNDKKILIYNISIIVSYRIDIVGVAISILSTPTIFPFPEYVMPRIHALLGAIPYHLLWARVNALRSL